MRRQRKSGRSHPSFARRYLPYIALIVLAVAVIIVTLVLTSVRNRTQPTETALQTENDIHVNIESESFTYDFSTTGWLDGVPAIDTLINTYLEARRTADIATLNRLLQSDSFLTEGNVVATSSYVEAYNNVKVYLLSGAEGEKDTYVAYVSYDQKFIGIDTPAPSLGRYYIVPGEEAGSYLIFNGTMSTERKAYLDGLDKLEDVTILKGTVNNNFKSALASDAALSDLINRLQTVQVTEPAATEAVTEEPVETTEEITTEEETSETETETEEESESASEDGTGEENSADEESEDTEEKETSSSPAGTEESTESSEAVSD